MSNVVVRVRTDAKQALTELDKVRKSFADLSKTDGWKNLVMGAGLGVGLGAFNAVTDAVRGLGDALAEGVQSAADEEAGLNRLAASLRANVPAWDGNTDAIERTIASRRRLAFTDDDLRQSFSTLVAATGNVSKAFDIQQTAMDLARLRNIDLQTASDALIRVEGGQYRILKSLGIQLKDNATQTEALAAVQAVAAGQADAYGNSAAAAFFRFNDAVKELYEAIGKRLLPVITPLVNGLTALVEGESEWEKSTAQAEAAARVRAAAVGDLANAWKYVRYEQSLVSDYPDTGGTIKPPDIDLEAWKAARDKAAAEAKKVSDAIAAALADGDKNVRAAMQTLVDAIADAKPAGVRAAELIGILSSRKMASGLKSGDPYVKAAAQTLRATIVDELKALGYDALALGQETAKLLATAFGGPGGNAMVSNAALDAFKQYAAFLDKFKVPEIKWPNVSGAASSAADATKDLVAQARSAVATLSGLKGMIGQLTATMQASWTPAVLTVAQAQANVSAATDKFTAALGKLKVGAASTLTAVSTAFANMKNAALAFYAAQRDARIADLNSAIAAVQANVQAFRDQLDGFRKARQQADLEEAARNARGIYSNALDQEIADLTAANKQKQRTEEETRLKLAVTQARTRKDRAAAQAALADYYERVHLEDLTAQRDQERAVQQADENLLDFQQDQQLASLQSAADYQTQLYQQQIAAAEQQYQAQVDALGRIAAAVEGGLESVKSIWDTKNRQALAILNGFKTDFQSAGRRLAEAVEAGVASVGTIYIDVVTRYTSIGAPVVGGTSNTYQKKATGGPVAAGRTYWVGERGPELLTMGAQSGYITPNNALGGAVGGQPVQINLVLDGRKVAEVVDERLFLKYRTAARTGASI